jgi:hypothetical protein
LVAVSFVDATAFQIRCGDTDVGLEGDETARLSSHRAIISRYVLILQLCHRPVGATWISRRQTSAVGEQFNHRGRAFNTPGSDARRLLNCYVIG